MDYKKYGETLYIRGDRGDEIIRCVLEVCRKEGIQSATFGGIGGCSEARIQTFIPEQGAFETLALRGMLELVSLTGNVNMDDAGEYYHHTHAAFAYKDGEQHRLAAATSSRSPCCTRRRSSCGRWSVGPSSASTTRRRARASGI